MLARQLDSFLDQYWHSTWPPLCPVVLRCENVGWMPLPSEMIHGCECDQCMAGRAGTIGGSCMGGHENTIWAGVIDC